VTYRIAFALKKRLLQCEASAFHDLQLLAAARSCAKKTPPKRSLIGTPLRVGADAKAGLLKPRRSESFLTARVNRGDVGDRVAPSNIFCMSNIFGID